MSTVKCLAYSMQNCMEHPTKGQPLMCCAYCPFNEGCKYKCENNPKRCGQSMVTMEDVPIPKRKSNNGSTTKLVEKLDPETGEVLMTYGSVAIAAIQNRIHTSSIYGAVNKDEVRCGYKWRYKEE